MPTINVSLDFSTADGEAEKFTSSITTYFSNGIYSSTEGNPAGSVRFDHSLGMSGRTASKRWPFPYASRATFEDLGVPVGATVTAVENFTGDFAYTETGSHPGNHGMWIQLQVNDVTVRNNGLPAFFTGPLAWTTPGSLSSSDAEFPCASNTYCSLIARMYSQTGASGSAQSFFDNFSFDIVYGAGADVSGTGILLSPAASTLGYSQAWPAVTEQAKPLTADSYSLIIDGLVLPLFGFTVTRKDNSETARISTPAEYASLIASATTLEIAMTSIDVYGNTTQNTLFSGSLDSYSKIGNLSEAYCIGAASWPVRKIRYFDHASYLSDDGNKLSFRAPVDPYFYPGFIGYYGLRRVDVNTIVYSVNQTQAFMELSNDGQL